jgi:alpha-L-fucosidase 2
MTVRLRADRPTRIRLAITSDFPLEIEHRPASLHAAGRWEERSTPAAAAKGYRYYPAEDDRRTAFALEVSVQGDARLHPDGTIEFQDALLAVDARTDFDDEGGPRGHAAIPPLGDLAFGQPPAAPVRPTATLHLGDAAPAQERTDILVRGARAGLPPDRLLNAVFDYGVHLLAASTTGGALPPTLQGIWCGDLNSAWGSKWTININLQMNLWGAGPVEVPGAPKQLLDFLEARVPTGAAVASRLYGADGWVLHHNTDIWRTAAPADLIEVGLWPMGGIWLALQAWDLVAFESPGPDRDRLAARALELLRGAAAFATSFLTEDSSGRLVTSPSVAPEVPYLDERTRAERPDRVHDFGRYAWLCEAPALDMWLVGDLLRTLSGIPGAGTDSERSLWSDMAKRLRPVDLAVDELSDWTHVPSTDTQEEGHRHLSPLYPVYPGSHDAVRDTALRETAIRTLEARFQGVRSSSNEFGGWTLVWAACIWARLGEGDRAVAALDTWVDTFLSDALLTTWPAYDGSPAPDDVFQIDSNLGVVAAIAEMLVQSHTDTIRVLPAVPARWRCGSVSGLRLRGGGTIDIDWSDGRIDQIVLHDLTAPRTLSVPQRLVRDNEVGGRSSELLYAVDATSTAIRLTPSASGSWRVEHE